MRAMRSRHRDTSTDQRVPRDGGGVVFVHAHPDDEAVATGGTIARLVSEGIRVDLVTCTDGAEGEVHDPELDPDEARPRLAAIRRRELACAVDALGDGAIHHHMLGHRDSGMMGTPSNDRPDAFWHVDLDGAALRVVEIVRAARPAAIVSYDRYGNYGHPDHINANRLARIAYDAAGHEARYPGAGAPHAVDRFYEIAFNRDEWGTLAADMKERGLHMPWDSDESAEAAAAGEATEAAEGKTEAAEGTEGTPDAQDDFGVPAASITTRVDVTAFVDRKRRAMECHRTQRQDMGWLLELPEDLGARALETEFFVLTDRRSAPIAEGYREDRLAAP
jgi:N-acetyl-1-D-myo-inositol-2-amino-2-deoxy-alpha-D-glucopyranoside deacetylase